MINSQTAYLSSAYLPPVQYFSKLAGYGKIMIEQHDNYTKQTYRNRCNIAGPGGILPLSIPTVRPDSPKCPMKDIRISDHGNWRHLHWNALESAYNKTPFFEYYKDDFRPFYEKKIPYLIDFNDQLIRLICVLADISPNINYTTEYKNEFGPNEIDFRDIIHPKKQISLDSEFTPKPYYQVFDSKHGFIPNLSVIDLLFNMGPESIFFLT